MKMLLQDYPDEGEILVYYAEACLELGEDDEAMLALNEVPENDPSYPWRIAADGLFIPNARFVRSK